MTVERKFIFRRTMLDIPFLIFLGSQIISTLLSIDFYTSVFGYYSRFNGGLLSTLAYLTLYYGFVSNFDAKETARLMKIFLSGSIIVAVYGILEHFGIDKSIWVQDVQSRVFSTLGQPNWLAAYLVALIPVTWALALKNGIKSKNFLIYFSISLFFFWTLIFTKSRSGFLGAGVATLIFWGLYVYKNIRNIKSAIGPTFLTAASLIVICLISGTQWTPSLGAFLNKASPQPQEAAQGTALETGGTESGIIRQIVWKGAVDIFLHYPVFGTGVETFAYSYYMYRPQAHNLTSEWDFIYNKAHNEFLNFAANSGFAGLTAYLAVIVFTVILILKSKNENVYQYGLTAGFVSLSVSNFFGFSVVPTQLEFYLFPAIAVSMGLIHPESKSTHGINNYQKFFVAVILLAALFAVVKAVQYWRADVLYATAKTANTSGRPDVAVSYLKEALNYQPGQAIYLGELAVSYATIAMAYDQAKEATPASQFTSLSAGTIEKAAETAPANVNIRRQMFGVYVRLSTINEDYLKVARDGLMTTIKQAPTDAKLRYNLGIANANLGETERAAEDFKKAIGLKPDYVDARIEYAALLVHLKQNEEAKNQLQYILTNIDPENQTAKQALANIN
jgi:O-antigen ligase